MKTNNQILLVIFALVTLLTSFGLNRFAQASPPIGTDTTPQWAIEAITPDFDAVDMATPTDGWAAADSLLYHYNGSKWQLTEQVDPSASIADLDMLSTTDGWAVGSRPFVDNASEEQGAIWHFNGNEWQAFPSPTDIRLRAVHMTSASSGWAVGSDQERGGVIIRYNGVAWEVVSSDFYGYNIDVISDNDVWLVGFDGGIYHYNGNKIDYSFHPNNSYMNAISMFSATDGWAVGSGSNGGTILHYDGTTWSEVASPTNIGLDDVVMLSATDGWAVGYGYNSQTSSDDSVILHYDGSSWQIVDSINSSRLKAISMASATAGWTVGDYGSILQYDGSAWQMGSDLLSPSASGANYLRAVDMLSATDGWALGYSDAQNGYVSLHYDGNKWNSSPIDQPFTAIDIDMLSATDGWVVGGRYNSQSSTYEGFTSHYDGNSWQLVSNPATNFLYAVDMLSPTDGWVVGGRGVILHYDGNSWQSVTSPTGRTLYDIEMISATDGWAVGSGVILHYDGNSWQSVSHPVASLHAVDMLSPTDGWAVGGGGDGGVILHYNGSNWQSVNTPTNEYLYDIAMLSANEGWAVGDNGTILYYNGSGWQQITPPTQDYFNAIAMLDSQTGRIVGYSGTILSLTKGGTYSISGQVTDSNGTGIAGVTVSAGSASATTDSNGNYTISGLANGEYTVTPTKEGYTFSPTSRSVTVQSADVTGQDFVGSVTGQGVDLQITSPSIKNSGPFYPGGSIGVSAQVQNASDGNVPASVISYWVSSTNDGVSLDSDLIARNSVVALSAGESSSERFSDLYIPAGLAPGTYYVVFEATNTNRNVTEPDESNNTTSLPFTIEPCANGTFCDVPETHTFHDEIVALYQNGLTSGCRSGVTPITYCPETLLDRAHTAAFLLRRKYGPEYEPPKATTQIFVDVPLSHGWANWINQLYEDNLTQGCRGSTPGVDLMYCPDYDTSGWDGYLKRADMATFLARLEGWDLSHSTTGVFADVTGDDYWERAAEYMWWKGYTNGSPQCENSTTQGGLTYCPNDYVHRGMAAGFMSRAFDFVRVEPRCATLTVNSNPSEGGSVSITPSSPDCPIDSSKYQFDTNITLTANPNSGYIFGFWSADASGSDNPTTISVGHKNRTVTANFSTQTSTYSISGQVTEHNKNGPGIEGIKIVVVGKEVNLDTTTDKNGEYRFDGLQAGNYLITATDDNDNYSLTPGPTRLTVPPDETYDFVGIGDLIDLTISLYKSANTATEREPYERILEYFADSIYEMSNGVHKIRNITIYQNGNFANTADVLWNESEWPRAYPSGYGLEGQSVYMADIFPFTNNPYDALSSSNRPGTGYTLGHEWGHYYYGLYDEYKGRQKTDLFYIPWPNDQPVPNSVMNSQWNAVNGDFNWLNFSITRNNTRQTAQHRVYQASGWETLARPVSEDPRDGKRSAFPKRTYYPELSTVAPIGNENPSIELPAAQAEARSELNVSWAEVARTSAQEEVAYRATVQSIFGNELRYPQPIIVVAHVTNNGNLVARAGIIVSVTAPDGTAVDFALKDDGVAPDLMADDGQYSGLMPYNQGGSYQVAVTFDNSSGEGFFTQASYQHAPSPNGETYIPNPQPVGENFSAEASTTIVITDFQTDDHSNSIQNATILLTDNVEISGRIDRGRDLDIFKVTPSETGDLLLRLSNLAFDMQAKIRVLAADGQTVINQFDFAPQGNEYFFTLLNVNAGESFYVEISHLLESATTGLYDISIGQSLANGDEPSNNRLYLPVIMR